jgi:hypothetical protein
MGSLGLGPFALLLDRVHSISEVSYRFEATFVDRMDVGIEASWAIQRRVAP